MFRKFIDHFKDPLEFFRLKTVIILLFMIAVLMLERRF